MRLITGFNKTVPFHWAGGKKWMAPFIAQYLPKNIINPAIKYLHI